MVPSIQCGSNEWKCMSGDVCIQSQYRCDDAFDCPDQSDEIGCEIRSSRCESDEWESFKTNCYFHSSEFKGWEDAESDCRQRGGHLTSIHSDEEHDFLSGLNFS